MAICLGVELLCALGFLAFVNAEAHEVWPIFGILVVLGTARAFWGPAAQSLAPNLVPPEALANAITVNTSAWQFASIAGPAAGGLLYGIAPTVAFGTGAALLVVAMVCVLLIPKPAQRESHQATSLETIFGGFRYIFSNKVVLGAISLDMFAVLMGGAVALLPIYAKDILHAGPQELGLLRAAPGIGAIVMALCPDALPDPRPCRQAAVPVRRPVRRLHRALRPLDHASGFRSRRWRWSARPTWSASPSARPSCSSGRPKRCAAASMR